jgi:hypothetical protein
VDKETPSSIFNHFSKESASIWPSNIGISKLTYTLKGEVLQKWPLDEDAYVVVNKHRRIWEKWFIILFFCFPRTSMRNTLIWYFSPSSLSSSTMGGHSRWQENLYLRETSSRPNSLCPDLVEDMH